MSFSEIDLEKIKHYKAQISLYKVKYYVFHTDKKQSIPTQLPKEQIKEQKDTVACYSGLLSQLRNNKDCKLNRLYTTMDIREDNYPLTYEEQCSWIKLAKKFKLLPYYITPKVFKSRYSTKISEHASNIAVLFNIEKLNIIQLYIYLVTLRNLRDEPGLIKGILHLYFEAGMNFFAAYVLSSHFNNNNSGHALINVSPPPYSASKPIPTSIEDSINLKWMIGLQRVVNNPFAYDEKMIQTLGEYVQSWNCSQKMIKAMGTNSEYVVPLKSLFNKHIIRAIMSSNKLSFDAAKLKYEKEGKEK